VGKIADDSVILRIHPQVKADSDVPRSQSVCRANDRAFGAGRFGSVLGELAR
jgi:hypothetical protein